MTAPALELAAQIRLTQAFIDAKYTDLILTPRAATKKGTGTRFYPGTPRGVQRVRIIDQSSASGPTPGTVRAGDGIQRLVIYQLLMAWDAELGLYDTWTDTDGVVWEVADILPFNGYEKRAQVVRYGE